MTQAQILSMYKKINREMKVEGGLNAAGHYGIYGSRAQVFPMMPFPIALLFVQQKYGGRWS